jgi:GNAT superfamily N-acetyltransferase
MKKLVVRLAEPSESEVLTRLAMTAKASWGYSEAFMEACRDELTMTPTKMSAWTVWVADRDGTICGMIAVNFGRASGNAELEDFFVDPIYQGRGVGWALMSVVFKACRSRDVRALAVDADPNAEKIYRKFGFATVGRAPSRSIPGRTLPRMELRITERCVAHSDGQR